MYIDRLSLTDFRTYAQADVRLGPGVNVLVGPNGVGKTNIVEAIGCLSTLSSHRVSTDAPMVRFNQERAVVRARIVRGGQQSILELEIAPGRTNRARINRSAPMRAREILGIARTVLFAPEDLALVKGEPGGRRRFLDDLVVTLYPYLGQARADYEKVLRQRNALLRSGRRGWNEGHESTIDVWDQQLATAATALTAARLGVLRDLDPHVETAYGRLTDGGKPTEIVYISSLAGDVDAQRLSPDASGAGELASLSAPELYRRYLEALAGARQRDRERGTTTIGPHRDDVALILGGAPAKGFASHGESWSFALALRLGAFELMRQDDPSEAACPILILDDVFAELDARRRQRLGALVQQAEQVIITAAVGEDLPADLAGRTLRVSPGTVTDPQGERA
ncbi:DNA replication/repair protein RecF [Falsarthrobacter nasiphocae]|uniref:DNA replication and repair protein RecF n=1 Tax=Falsarthrobacter nasiphocae TaxID=189863 RepID=A0AAE3YH35_9MICC|nr:DNA replication/repair protein RecF [Falsarthrobacter nasiphocae]MDR6892070.1 DNA replication and repair protein RecF [Falsarthrobacter nasiphocae]